MHPLKETKKLEIFTEENKSKGPFKPLKILAEINEPHLSSDERTIH